MKVAKLVSVSMFAALLSVGAAFAQTVNDPGVQAATRHTGLPLAQVANNDTVGNNSNPGISAFFNDGLNRFQDVESVSGQGNNGLGPRFNFNQCGGCHAQPAVGGTGPAVNPEFKAIGTCNGVGSLSTSFNAVAAGQFEPLQTGVIACSSTNTTPAFITANGPTREARFPFFFNANGTVNTNNPNGGVESLFTVSGRPDGATNCNIPQPGFAAAASANDLVFRIPTPLFGVGLIENLDDSTLLSNRLKNLNNNVGVAGSFNRSGNDNSISRFGWKAQNKSLHIFAGEAYTVEMGITNLVFPNERALPGEDGADGGTGTGLPSTCLDLGNLGYPEDNSNPAQTSNPAVLDDVSAFANFMRDLAPPPTGGVVNVTAASISNGASLFVSVGCSVCHNPNLGNTQHSSVTPNSSGAGSLSFAPVPAFSDIELHHMGTGLADNVSQGNAGGDQFRTAPLWGVGQRIFLLHDGRFTNIVQAVNAHGSSGSEANTALNNAAALTIAQQQDLVNFLRSL